MHLHSLVLYQIITALAYIYASHGTPLSSWTKLYVLTL